MIEVADLSFTYAGAASEAVTGLGFTVAPGEVFGFLGPSGAGKSTTQKILIGLLRGYRGTVTVFGRPPADQGGDYYERIGVGFEFPNHFAKLTGRENLAYFAALYRRPTRSPEEVLGWVGLEGDGGMPVGQYSKGMKVRLGVARALLHRPDLLFLDEPTAGLDPVNARRIKDLIRAERDGGRTVFLTTHDMAVADELCDRVAFLVDGRIALIDAPRALKLRYGERRVRVEVRREAVPNGTAGTAANGGAGGDNAVGGGAATERFEFPLAGLGDDAAFLALLRGGRVETLHTMEATLEEIFIRLTGRSLG